MIQQGHKIIVKLLQDLKSSSASEGSDAQQNYNLILYLQTIGLSKVHQIQFQSFKVSQFIILLNNYPGSSRTDFRLIKHIINLFESLIYVDERGRRKHPNFSLLWKTSCSNWVNTFITFKFDEVLFDHMINFFKRSPEKINWSYLNFKTTPEFKLTAQKRLLEILENEEENEEQHVLQKLIEKINKTKQDRQIKEYLSNITQTHLDTETNDRQRREKEPNHIFGFKLMTEQVMLVRNYLNQCFKNISDDNFGR